MMQRPLESCVPLGDIAPDTNRMRFTKSMFTQRKPQPNEVVGACVAQDALHRLHEFHAAWLAGRNGGRRAMLRSCDLGGRDLSGMDFSAAALLDCDLTGSRARNTKFAGAVLHNVKLDHADLTGADFAGAELQGTSLIGAQLAGTVLDRGARRPDPKRIAEMLTHHDLWVRSEGAEGARADFAGLDLSARDLSHCNLCAADLSGAMLVETRFKGTQLIAADFRNANLSWANLSGADIRGANFAGAYRLGTDFSNTHIGPVPGLALSTRGL